MYTEKRRQTDGIVVYRGEPDVYDQPCRPNIFRRGVLNSNCFFEKNLFDTMRQNKLYVSLHREEYGEADSNLFKKSDCYRGLMRELEQVVGENEREPQEDGGEDRKSSNTNRKVKQIRELCYLAKARGGEILWYQKNTKDAVFCW